MKKKLIKKNQNGSAINVDPFLKYKGSDLENYHANTNYGYNGKFDESEYELLWKKKFAKEHPFWGSGLIDFTGNGRANWDYVKDLYLRDKDIVRKRALKLQRLLDAAKQNAELKGEMQNMHLDLADAQIESYVNGYSNGHSEGYALGQLPSLWRTDTIPVKNNGQTEYVLIRDRYTIPVFDDVKSATRLINVYPNNDRDTTYISDARPDNPEKAYESVVWWYDSDKKKGNKTNRMTKNLLTAEEMKLFFTNKQHSNKQNSNKQSDNI